MNICAKSPSTEKLVSATGDDDYVNFLLSYRRACGSYGSYQLHTAGVTSWKALHKNALTMGWEIQNLQPFENCHICFITRIEPNTKFSKFLTEANRGKISIWNFPNTLIFWLTHFQHF